MKVTLASAALVGLATLASAAPALQERALGRHWPGYNKLKYLYVFGDSYTQTGFNITNGSPLPSPSNPLGNPTYPGWTSANGPNWVDYLTVEYNKTVVQTYNLAYGGATIDSDLVKPYSDEVLSLKYQVDNLFLPYLAKPAAGSKFAKWRSTDSLFLFWIGINDIGMSWWYLNTTTHDVLLDEYFRLAQELYDVNARNFVFINVPPIERSPMIIEQNSEWSNENLNAMLLDFNSKLKARVAKFEKDNRAVSTWYFDSHALFNTILNTPKTIEWNFENTTEYCSAYQNGTPAWDTYVEECGVPVDQYFWLNNLHPTHKVHKALAKKLANSLDKLDF